MQFRLSCVRPDAPGEIRHFYYDNRTGLLHDSDGVSVGSPRPDLDNFDPAFRTEPSSAPIRKHSAPRILKVQLGLSCNFSCSYCLQKHVERAEETSVKMLPGFIEKVERFLSGSPDNIQLWGGEPLVYLKALKPLVRELKSIYPTSKFTMITNGSLLSAATNNWIIENEIGISISHDGPGQKFRGPDPFDEPDTAAAILDLYWRKKADGDPVSFGAMIHTRNPDRGAIARWFREKIGDPDVIVGEGALIEVYDEGGWQNSPQTPSQRLDLRKLALGNIRRKADRNFVLSHSRMNDWLQTMWYGRQLDSLGMKCGMDSQDTLTVDLRGNVLTCQNVSPVSNAPNGHSHCGGSIDRIEDVEIRTSVHFMNRRFCHGCPVVQVCRGGCMYLTGELFQHSCDNTYTDHIPYFAAAIEALTGCLLVYIEDEIERLPEERKDVFGFGKPEAGYLKTNACEAVLRTTGQT